MLEQFSPLMIKAWLDDLLDGLKKSLLPMPNAWTHSSVNDICVESGDGLLLIQWRPPESKDRLKATFCYNDAGVFPFVSLVFDQSNVLQELEVWRGDGKPLNHAPVVSDLVIPVKSRRGSGGRVRH